MLLCDIGTVDSIPITVAKSYASDLTIAVDVGQEHTTITHCKSAFEVLMRMEDIGERLMRRYVLPEADIVIRPHVGESFLVRFPAPRETDRRRPRRRRQNAETVEPRVGRVSKAGLIRVFVVFECGVAGIPV